MPYLGEECSICGECKKRTKPEYREYAFVNKGNA